MKTVVKWVNGAKVLVEEPETSGPTMQDLKDALTIIEAKIELLAKQAGAYVTLEGVTTNEKASLADVPIRFRDGGGR